ncbi:ABC transporter substrate-binding protein [Mycolicibacterium aichiense]|uniref:ABC transporter substrate-binding protein n=1 Tax=Mycolicibacterium aichiense TaxID=1799 RepID=A0AAD1HLK6_9MYCO|nr:ABC transporter substrate-binding protein [Mycolicibacterium aichiense]MCV7017972.1 ABC transporter substrate-binding protein [Mycolicibacterium aichiense]BBX06411.1 ABC transporter substrate-binding protein [Mycolicibacterium aichiense]STZ24253.1 extracellular solute-binding protein [Mycolicibacterium aichiense]
MPAPFSTRTRAAIAVGTALAAALTGCSSDSTDAAPTGPAAVAPPAILQAGTLKVCAPNDGTPPSVYHDESGALVGSEVDLAKALAAQMGLKPEFVETAFSSVIPTLQAKQCDVIMAQLYIKPEREKVVDFVPYVYSGTGIAVSKEHPAAITGMDDSLCGKKVIVAVATTAEELAVEQSGKCTAAGKPEIDITRNSHADVALQQVQNGQVDAYLDTAETLGYYATKTGAQIQLAGKPFGTIKIGAATLKGDTALHDAIAKALGELEANGTYAKILGDWGQTDLDIQK